MSVYLGVDGGNTKTLAFIADEDGQIIGVGRSANSDIYANPDHAIDEIALAVQTALDQAGIERQAIASACFSLAGADWQEDYIELREGLAARGLGAKIVVYNDAIGALRAGSPDGTGVVITCGTGGAMGARNIAGEYWHTSYWQDSMCGRELGYQAIRAVRHADIGMEQPTALTRVLLEFFKVDSVAGMLRRFTLRPINSPTDIEVSKLAPFILDLAEQGDPVARAMIIDHGTRLADYGLAAARKVGIEWLPFHLVLNGGIFRHPGILMSDTIVDRILTVAPAVMVHRSRYEPVVGALMLAFEADAHEITQDRLEAFERTMPPKMVFKT